MTKEEKLITFLLTKYENGKTNIVSVSKNDIGTINLTEQENIQNLYLLQEDGYIIIKEKSVHDDLSRYWNVALKSSAIHYFENKKEHKLSRKRDWIKTYIPIIISLMALIKSYSPEIISIMERLSKLIKQLSK